MSGELEGVKRELGLKEENLSHTSRMLNEKSSELEVKVKEYDEKLQNLDQKHVRKILDSFLKGNIFSIMVFFLRMRFQVNVTIFEIK